MRDVGVFKGREFNAMSVLKFDCLFAYSTGFVLEHAFEMEDGVTALVGPSGIGKTTTLQLIAGILTPARGRITLRDRVLFDSSRRVNASIEERHIGFVFQDYMLFPHLNVEENLKYGFHRRQAASRVNLDHLIEVFELGDLLKRYPVSLSGGQKQRVAVGRAFASNPEILLLDEPVSALDESLKANLLDYLAKGLKEYSIPTLLVTHDQSVVERMQAKVVQLPFAVAKKQREKTSG